MAVTGRDRSSAAAGGHVVVAPDKFKGSLTAVEAAGGIRRGLLDVVPGLEVRCLPMADGGEGTVNALVSQGFRRVEHRVTGPTGRPVVAAVGLCDGTAVVELAEASGLRQLRPSGPDPLRATSRGTGELLRAALDAGCRRIILGLGGSACTDGGAGLLQALGARLLDVNGAEVPPGGQGLLEVDRVDLTGLDPRLASTTVVVASDVDSPLLGAHGAAAVYGPQKGATPAQVALLETGLQRWADALSATVVRDHSAEPGAGAAGGVGLAAFAVLRAVMRPGIDVVMDATRLHDHVPGALFMVTGEGSLDAQSLRGKAPIGIARAAAAHRVTTIAVAGRCELSASALRASGFTAAYALTDLEPDRARCMSDAPHLVREVGRRIARTWLADGAPAAGVSGSRPAR